MPATWHIRTIESRPFMENTYVVWAAGQTLAVVVDPGMEPESILECLADEGLTVAAILNTHGHADHIAGNADLKAAFPTAPLIIGVGDADMLTDPEANLSAGYGLDLISPPADRTVRSGEVLDYAGLRFTVAEIPGHSPGHVVFIAHDLAPKWVLGGDVLFRGSIGRTDFPGGSLEQLLIGIRRELWPLPAETIVYPGHGPTTTVGHERRTNPFCGQEARR